MKNLILILTLTGILCSCNNSDDQQNVINPNLFGKWKLIETLNDPGDGSGVFESIDSEKTIEFFDDGTFSLSGPLCGLSPSAGKITKGNVGSSMYTSDNTLSANESCDLIEEGTEYVVTIEGAHLILSWSACIEGCYQKYEKLE